MIFQQKTFRVTILLSVVFVIISMILLGLNFSYHKKITSNERQIQDAQMQLRELQNIVSTEEAGDMNQRIMGRTFAPYDEIVPFIGLLESLFAIIDMKSNITVRDEEKQIFINRYADYEVRLNPGNKVDLFLKALDELYKSKYITKVTSFNINYSPDEKTSKNIIEDITLTIRLYFE